jgi:hypothetical protein
MFMNGLLRMRNSGTKISLKKELYNKLKRTVHVKRVRKMSRGRNTCEVQIFRCETELGLHLQFCGL